MAPDKIWVTPSELTVLLAEKRHDYDVAYVRKDVLMEWVKEHKCVIETHGDERDAYLRGEYSVLNSLIDKLNLM